MLQSRYVNNKVKEENNNTQEEIKAFVGEEEFAELVKNQETFYAEYFKTEETEPETPVDQNEPEVIEAEVESPEEPKEKDDSHDK